MGSKSIKLRGLFPAPSVPFDKNLDIVKKEFSNHIASMGRIAGIGGVAVNGHQGEMLALSSKERQKLIELARDNLPARKFVISGVLSSSVPGMVKQLREAKSAGADAALVMPPFDYMPRRILARSWEAPYAFFAKVAEKVDLPLVIFQYPFSSGIWYSTETMVRLATIDTVVGVKHAIRHLELYAEQYEALRGKISILAARDAPGLLSKMIIGADGACIGISNIAPEHWATFVTHCLENRLQEAKDIFLQRLMPLITNVWSESMPRRITYSASTKEALVQLGVFSSSTVRPPELDVNEQDRAQIREGLQRAGLLPKQSPIKRTRTAG